MYALVQIATFANTLATTGTVCTVRLSTKSARIEMKLGTDFASRHTISYVPLLTYDAAVQMTLMRSMHVRKDTMGGGEELRTLQVAS